MSKNAPSLLLIGTGAALLWGMTRWSAGERQEGPRSNSHESPAVPSPTPAVHPPGARVTLKVWDPAHAATAPTDSHSSPETSDVDDMPLHVLASREGVPGEFSDEVLEELVHGDPSEHVRRSALDLLSRQSTGDGERLRLIAERSLQDESHAVQSKAMEILERIATTQEADPRVPESEISTGDFVDAGSVPE